MKPDPSGGRSGLGAMWFADAQASPKKAPPVRSRDSRRHDLVNHNPPACGKGDDEANSCSPSAPAEAFGPACSRSVGPSCHTRPARQRRPGGVTQADGRTAQGSTAPTAIAW